MTQSNASIRLVQPEYRVPKDFVDRLIDVTGFDINWIPGTTQDELFFMHLKSLLREGGAR